MKTLFNSISPNLINQRKLVHDVCRQFNRSPSKGNLARIKNCFAYCGKDVFIEYGFHMDYGDSFSIGDRTFINTNFTLIDGPNETQCQVRIGDDCLIGPNVQLLAVSHDIEPNARLNKANYVDDIILGNNVWLGGGVVVLSGITIGDNTVVGAGSVVTKHLEGNSFYAGNPAVKIREL